MLIHAISPGPDGTVVGGSYINQGFFVYDPESDVMRSPGRAVEFPGQIDNLTTVGRRVYIGHYTKARFSVYNFDDSWNPGYERHSNPKFLGFAAHEQDRVPTGTVGPDGKVYFGTKPGYGKLGGSIVAINPQTDSLAVFRNVIDDQSMAGCGLQPRAGSLQPFYKEENGLAVWEFTPRAAPRFLDAIRACPD